MSPALVRSRPESIQLSLQRRGMNGCPFSVRASSSLFHFLTLGSSSRFSVRFADSMVRGRGNLSRFSNSGGFKVKLAFIIPAEGIHYDTSRGVQEFRSCLTFLRGGDAPRALPH